MRLVHAYHLQDFQLNCTESIATANSVYMHAYMCICKTRHHHICADRPYAKPTRSSTNHQTKRTPLRWGLQGMQAHDARNLLQFLESDKAELSYKQEVSPVSPGHSTLQFWSTQKFTTDLETHPICGGKNIGLV